MGLFDALFGNRNQIPTVTTILPDAASQEIIAGRLPILNVEKRFTLLIRQSIWSRKQ